MNSLQIPREKLSIRNVNTQPGESGPNPTINAIVKFNALIPEDELFSPSLSCIVYDYLFKGLSQPQIGVFSINLGKAYKKKKPHAIKSHRTKNADEHIEINLEFDSNSTGNQISIRKMERPTIDQARSGAFVIYPEYVLDKNGKSQETVKPDNSYISLGYDRTPQDRIMHYRYFLNSELENTEYIEKSPFEIFQIKRGQERGEDSWISTFFSKKNEEATSENTSKIVGLFKGIVRVTKSKVLQKTDKLVQDLKRKRTENPNGNIENVEDNLDEDFHDIRKLLLQKSQVIVRVYIIACQNLAQKDLKSQSDPYIKIKLAGAQINDSKNYQTDQPNPKIFKHFDIVATLPGASRLKIQVWDKDDLIKDDKIGETVIDLEDRYFSNKWRRITEKPIEKRQLMHRSTKLSQGSILLWLEIHQPSSLPPPLDISEKPPAEFQARLIIWQTSGVADADVEGTSDLYVRAFVNDNKPKETDTHYRCQNGKGQFN